METWIVQLIKLSLMALITFSKYFHILANCMPNFTVFAKLALNFSYHVKQWYDYWNCKIEIKNFKSCINQNQKLGYIWLSLLAKLTLKMESRCSNYYPPCPNRQKGHFLGSTIINDNIWRGRLDMVLVKDSWNYS